MNIILIGPQGSGKGTQAQLLAKKFKLPVFGAGRLFRSEVQKGTKLGQEVAKFVNQGFLVPDHYTFELLKKEIKKKKYSKGAVYDGFPRDFMQMRMLEKLIVIDVVIYIKIRQKETIRRLASRRVCECGEIYNILTDKPKHDLICDKCGKKLKIRADDTPQAIKERLLIYKKQTWPLLKYYQKQKKLLEISGEQPIKKVFSQILKQLKKK